MPTPAAIFTLVRSLRDRGLTLEQWYLLQFLAGEPSGSSIGELSALRGTSDAATSGLVSKLRARGLLMLSIDPQDHRIRRIHLSTRGMDLLHLLSANL